MGGCRAAFIVLGVAPKVYAAGEVDKTVVSTAEVEKQVKITKDQAKSTAVKKLKEYLNYTIDETGFQMRAELSPSYYYYQNKNSYVWFISWEKQDRDKYIYIYASVDANSGELTSLRKSENSNTKPQTGLATFTRAEAQKTAETFLKKYYADKVSQCKLVENNDMSYYSTNYTFSYIRTLENDILCEGNAISIDIDGNTNQVIGFTKTWDETPIKVDLNGILTKEDALKVYGKEAKVELSYIPYTDKYSYEKQPQSTRLVYSFPELQGIMVDAKTGKTINNYYGSNVEVKVKDLKEDEKKLWLSTIAESQPGTAEMDSAAATEVILSTLKNLYGKEYAVDYLRYQENQNNGSGAQKSWAANFYEKDSATKQTVGEISIDALTKNVIYLYNYNYNYDEKAAATITWEQAYLRAIYAVGEYYPNRAKNINTKQTYVAYTDPATGKPYQNQIYYFSFQRTENGIPYLNNYVSVAVNTQTGLISELSSYWSDGIKFDSKDGIKTLDETKSIIFDKFKPQLYYTPIPTFKADGTTEYEYKLVYRLNNDLNSAIPPYISASTGKFLGYDGQEILEINKDFLTKLVGSKYEKELTLLAYQQVIDTNNFTADKKITRMDFYKMIVNAKGYNPYLLETAAGLKFSNVAKTDANYGYLQLAVYYGILDNEDGIFEMDATISREEMAKVFVKLLNYDNLAKSTDIFTLSVKDKDKITNGNIGYVAIAKSLGVLQVENESIRPKDDATMLEAAIAIYNVLGSLRTPVIYY